MATIKPIRTDGDLERALERINEIFDAEEGTPESDELDVLTVLVEHYEDERHPIGLPPPIAAIEFRMEQAGLTKRDLIPFLGSRSRVSEVLSGKRAITMSMARALHRHLGIPAEVLLQEPGASFDPEYEDLEPGRFPLMAMAKAGWIPDCAGPEGPRRRAGPRPDQPRRGPAGGRRAVIPQERPSSHECQDGRLCTKGVVLASDGRRAGKPA